MMHSVSNKQGERVDFSNLRFAPWLSTRPYEAQNEEKGVVFGRCPSE
jgi:hypothetical protein